MQNGELRSFIHMVKSKEFIHSLKSKKNNILLSPYWLLEQKGSEDLYMCSVYTNLIHPILERALLKLKTKLENLTDCVETRKNGTEERYHSPVCCVCSTWCNKINNTVSKYSSAVHAAFECFILIVTIMEFTNKQKRGYISYSTFDNGKANKYYSKINQTGIFRHITNN